MIRHAFTNPAADGTATSVVRPRDWNSEHVLAQTLSGNVSGNSAFTAGNMVLEGGPNITLSGVVAGAMATLLISAPAPVPALNFADSNGLIFGTNGSQVTASYTVPTTYPQSLQPVAFSGSNGSNTANTLRFHNANGVTFATGNNGVSASVRTDYAASDVTTAAIPATSLSALVQTSGLSGFSSLASGAMPLASSSALQFRSNTSAITSAAMPLSASADLQFTSNASDLASWAMPSLSSSALQFRSNTSAITSAAMPKASSSALQFTSATSVITSAAMPLASSSAFQFSSNTSAITSAAMQKASSSALQFTSGTSAITSAAMPLASSSAFQFSSGTSVITSAAMPLVSSSALQLTSNTSAITSLALPLASSSAIQFTTNTSAITSNAIHSSQSSLFTGGGAQYSMSNANGFGFTTFTSNSQVSVSDAIAVYGIGVNGSNVGASSNSISVALTGNLTAYVPSINANTLELGVPYPTLSLVNLSGSISTQAGGGYVIRLTGNTGGGGSGGGVGMITYTGTDGEYDSQWLPSPVFVAYQSGGDWNSVAADVGNDGTNDVVMFYAQYGAQKRIAAHTEHASTYRNLSETIFSNRPVMVPLPSEEFRRMNPNYLAAPINDQYARIFVSGAASSNRSLGGTLRVGLYTKGYDTDGYPVWSRYASASDAFDFTASSQSSAWNGPMLVQLSGLSASDAILGYDDPRALLMFSPVSANATWFNLPIYGAPSIPTPNRMYSEGATAAINSAQSIAACEGIFTTTTAALPASFGSDAFMASASQHLLRPWFELFDPSGLAQ